MGGIVSIPVAKLISKALMIFIISAAVASLKLNDEESLSLSLILFIPVFLNITPEKIWSPDKTFAEIKHKWKRCVH